LHCQGASMTQSRFGIHHVGLQRVHIHHDASWMISLNGFLLLGSSQSHPVARQSIDVYSCIATCNVSVHNWNDVTTRMELLILIQRWRHNLSWTAHPHTKMKLRDVNLLHSNNSVVRSTLIYYHYLWFTESLVWSSGQVSSSPFIIEWEERPNGSFAVPFGV